MLGFRAVRKVSDLMSARYFRRSSNAKRLIGQSASVCRSVRWPREWSDAKLGTPGKFFDNPIEVGGSDNGFVVVFAPVAVDCGLQISTCNDVSHNHILCRRDFYYSKRDRVSEYN